MTFPRLSLYSDSFLGGVGSSFLWPHRPNAAFLARSALASLVMTDAVRFAIARITSANTVRFSASGSIRESRVSSVSFAVKTPYRSYKSMPFLTMSTGFSPVRSASF